jgi:hypothetical protein
MATRTIPTILPVIAQSELATGRPLKSDVFRRFAQAQNFLWSNLRRGYAFWANDGEGNFISGKSVANVSAGSKVGGWEDPGIGFMPGGGAVATDNQGLCVATFAIPRAQSGNTKIKFQGRANFQRNVGTAVIRVTLHELDNAETYLGAYGEASISATNAAWDWTFDLAVPTNRPIVGKLWIGGALGSSTSGTGGTYDLLTLDHVSARWLPSGDFGVVGALGFEPTAFADAAVDRCVDVAVLDQIRRQISSLAGSRGQTEVLQTYFGPSSNRSGTFVEVGRYNVYVSTLVNLIAIRLYVLQTTNGTTDYGQMRVKWDGAVVATFSMAGSAQYSVLPFDATFAPVTDDAEHTLTIEVMTKNGTVTNEGCDVLGVFAYEAGISIGSFPTAPPAAFAPLDEARLRANDTIVTDVEYIDGARTGAKHLLANNLWLAKHRLRSLVGDWRRRTLKRIADESGTQVGASAGGWWDWTRGLQAAGTLQNSKPKNITVRGDLTVNDGWARGAANHDTLDGYGNYPTGYSDSGASGVTSSWPGSQVYKGHGRRLAIVYCAVPAGYSMHASDGTATSSFFARARRARPAMMGKTFDGATLGPTIEEPNWKNRGSLEVDWPSTGGLSLPIRSTSPAAVDDTNLRWLPVQSKLSYVGAGNIRGRLPIAFIPISSANVLEGTLFEVELAGLLVMDDPLPLASLALLA